MPPPLLRSVVLHLLFAGSRDEINTSRHFNCVVFSSRVMLKPHLWESSPSSRCLYTPAHPRSHPLPVPVRAIVSCPVISHYQPQIPQRQSVSAVLLVTPLEVGEVGFSASEGEHYFIAPVSPNSNCTCSASSSSHIGLTLWAARNTLIVLGLTLLRAQASLESLPKITWVVPLR